MPLLCRPRVWCALLACLACLASLRAEPVDPDLLDLEARGRNFVQLVLRKELLRARAEMSDRLRVALSDEALGRILWDFHTAGGPLREVGGAKASVLPDGRVNVLVPLHAARRTALAEVVFERKAPLAKVVAFQLNQASAADVALFREQGLLPREDNDPPPYVESALVVERPVALPGSLGPLEALLTLPAVAGPTVRVPGVVFVCGPDAADADGTVGRSRVVRDVAHGLAMNGVAAIRFTPATVAWPDAFGAEKLTSLNDLVVIDAMAATALLAAHPAVDPARVAIVGWGFGAYVAPDVARATGAGTLVLMAPAHPTFDTWLQRRLTDDGVEGAANLAGLPLIALAEKHFGLVGPLWMELRRQNVAKDIAAAGIPFALLFADADPLYDPADEQAWADAVRAAGVRAAVRTYERHDQWFRAMQPGGPDRYVAERLTDDLALFVQRHRLPE
ncbi:MAG: hypothetical protein KF858_06645 [Candidatus Sumerlaeia bacterium]|nr:hypothetical protein [Candidatus Sumerlaeia bacterium]